jgi:hypothetical protein
MTGGIIQLVISGKQDSYLTFNPQITYFKKVYRRHTVFSTELMEISPEQQPNYNNNVSFNLNNISDLVSKCYVEINLPTLSFTENPTITLNKQTQLSNIQANINKFNTLYSNLKQFCSIEILLYINLINILPTLNLKLNTLKTVVINFNNSYKDTKTALVNLILDDVYKDINLSGYILGLNKIIIQDNEVSNNNTIYLSDLTTNINSFYNNMNKYLNYYYSNMVFYQNSFNNLSSNNVPFAWVDYIAHFYFTTFEVSIGGIVVEQYTAEQSFIYMSHHLKEEQKQNYNVLVGHNQTYNIYDNNTKQGQTLLLPLNFWFCKEMGGALPLVALANSSVSINLKLDKLKNLLYFEDYEKDFYNALNITIPYNIDTHNKLNIKTFSYDTISKIASYECINVNMTLYTLQFPNVPSATVSQIFSTYGIPYTKKNNTTENVLDLIQWIKYRINYASDNTINPSNYNNYNELLSSVPLPNIKLITESIYLDDIERNKFASSTLEYVVEIFQQNDYTADNNYLFNDELSIDRPIKELLWYSRPTLFIQGLSEYGKVYKNTFDFEKFFSYNYYSQEILYLSTYNIIKNLTSSVYLNSLQSYKYYNNSLPLGVNAYNFGLYPEEMQPSGSVNMSVIKGKLFNFTFNNNFVNQYMEYYVDPPTEIGINTSFMARGYNFFIVEKGMGRMIFSTF